MEWIKIEDRLPEEGKLVLRYGKDFCKYDVDYIITFDNPNEPYVWASVCSDENLKITHWMELPTPPS